MRPKQSTLWRVVLACVLTAAFIALGTSRPVRLRYHKWRLVAAKQEHLRLGRGEYRFSDKMRELLLGKTITWTEVEATWKRHEDALVDLGFLFRIEFYPRRGNVPSKGNPEFAKVIQKMDASCPYWSYRASKSETSLTVTATKECLELWKKLAPSVGLRQEKPTTDERRCSGKRRLRSRNRPQRDGAVSAEWAGLFGYPAAP